MLKRLIERTKAYCRRRKYAKGGFIPGEPVEFELDNDEEMNNWRKMHGLPMRRKGRGRKDVKK